MTIFSKIFKRSRGATNFGRSISSPLEGGNEGAEGALNRTRTSSLESATEEPQVHRRQAGDFQNTDQQAAWSHLRTSTGRASVSSTGSMNEDSFSRRYSRIQLFHRGRNAMIMRARDRITNLPVTLKAYSKQTMTNSKKRALERETEMLTAASGHCGVVSLIRKAEDEDYFYLVLESCPGHTLIEEIAYKGKITEAYAAEIIANTLDALAFLHERQIVHRDLKPEHIICSKGSVKLVDFAEAADKHQHRLNDRVGTLEYMAPELLNKPTAEEVFHEVLVNGMSDDELPTYNEKADIWSLGATLYEMLTGCQPFFAERLAEMKEVQEAAYQRLGPDGIPHFIAQHNLSPAGQSFVSQMLCADHKKRPSAHDLLQHPWLQQHRGKKQEGPEVTAIPSNVLASGEPRHSTSSYRSPVCFWAKTSATPHVPPSSLAAF